MVISGSDRQFVIVTNLGTPEFEFEGRLADEVADGMRIITNARLAPGSSVRVDASDFLVLGEVSQCEQEGSVYVLRLQVHHLASHSRIERLRAKVTQASKSG